MYLFQQLSTFNIGLEYQQVYICIILSPHTTYCNFLADTVQYSFKCMYICYKGQQYE